MQREEELQDGKEVPEEVARNFTCAMFEAAQDVLKGARHMVYNLIIKLIFAPMKLLCYL